MGHPDLTLSMSGLENCAADNKVPSQFSVWDLSGRLSSAGSCQMTRQHAEQHELLQEHRFLNGDVYVGSWHGAVPDGIGKYLWLNRCLYEGEWVKGKRSGIGKIFWPSGATYEGDFLAGFIHGFGRYIGVDGTMYTGNWFLNEKRGFGTKIYANGDFYKGTWDKGLPDGEGKYVWKNGDMYVGEWRSGAKSGKGVLMWACGDKFGGQWMDGFEHGHGIYTWKDTSTYTGTWKRGLRDGRGTFVPARTSSSLMQQESSEGKCSDFPMLLSSKGMFQCDKDQGDLNRGFMLCGDELFQGKVTASESSTSSDSGLEDCASLERSWSLDDSFDGLVILDDDACDLRRQASDTEVSNGAEAVALALSVFERHYVEGVLVSEVAREASNKLQDSSLAREPIRAGEAICKGHQSYELMLSLQLGIRYTIGNKSLEQTRDINMSDFGPKARVWMSFPKQGSQRTPSHQSMDFKWKDYCPAVFRHLRELFKIDTAEYMMSICGSNGLRELSSPGKSGSVFYLSHDGQFLIKTVRKAEGKVLLGMLLNYHSHILSNKNTLLAKFYGFHRIKPAGGPKVRFVVMANILCTDLWIHRRFDLKGSSQGRSVHKLEMDETTTLKDLDLNFVFRVGPLWREALLRQVESDCKFLESERIMDYSLLLGLHFQSPQFPATSLSQRSKEISSERTSSRSEETKASSGDIRATGASHLVMWQSSETVLPTVVPHADAHSFDEQETARLQMQLGSYMPAKAASKPSSNGKPGGQQREPQDVLLYLGIIDILQQYDMGKKLERAYKSVQHDPLSISAVDPSLYSRRFRAFIQKTFPGSAGS